MRLRAVCRCSSSPRCCRRAPQARRSRSGAAWSTATPRSRRGRRRCCSTCTARRGAPTSAARGRRHPRRRVHEAGPDQLRDRARRPRAGRPRHRRGDDRLPAARRRTRPSRRVAPLLGGLPHAPLGRAIAAAVDDTLTSIGYLRRHAGRLGIDVRRLGLVGSSAGAMTAGHVAYVLDDYGIKGPKVRFVGDLGAASSSPAERASSTAARRRCSPSTATPTRRSRCAATTSVARARSSTSAPSTPDRRRRPRLRGLAVLHRAGARAEDVIRAPAPLRPHGAPFTQ